jgi:ABC-type dipeptide/oligopeptide/nickel transport system permease subunit
MKYVILLVGLIVILIAPALAPYDPMTTDTTAALHAPDMTHPLGTDHLGRDVLSRVLYGGQRTIFVTISATLGALCLGIIIGMSLSAWPLLRLILTPIITACLALPPLLLALVLLTLWGRGMLPLIAALILPQTPVIARAVQSAIRPLQASDYVLASFSSGAARSHVLRWHIWPNLLPFLQRYSGVLFSQMLFQAGALSLLELGGEPGVPDWGAMLADGRSGFLYAPWTVLAPGLLMVMLVVVVNRVTNSRD